MEPSLITRRAQQVVDEARTGFRVVIVNGPRQSGKSTLLHQIAGPDGVVQTLDDRAALQAARTDPTGFVRSLSPPRMIDEVQRGGDPLVLAVKAAVDEDPSPGAFVLAGSSRFLTVPTLSESLAGRARIVDLWPLSQGELDGGADALVDRLYGETDDLRSMSAPSLSRGAVMERVVLGGYPEVHRLPPNLRRDWFEDYRRTLVQRDLTELRRIRQTSELSQLFRMAASRTAGELKVSAFADALGLAAGTAKEYLGLLEVIYVHHLLPGWSATATGRARRRPKLHFVDSGLAADTVGAGVDRLSSPMSTDAGALLESFVVGEVCRQRTWSAVRPDIFHFRDREQREVDIVLEARDGRVAAIEVKAAVDVDEHDTRWLRYLRDRLGDRFVNGVVLHLGARPVPLGDRITALPVAALWT